MSKCQPAKNVQSLTFAIDAEGSKEANGLMELINDPSNPDSKNKYKTQEDASNVLIRPVCFYDGHEFQLSLCIFTRVEVAQEEEFTWAYGARYWAAHYHNHAGPARSARKRRRAQH